MALKMSISQRRPVAAVVTVLLALVLPGGVASSAGAAPLAFSSFLGGAGSDNGLAIAVDAKGESYVAGRTSSADFPTTTSAFDTTYNGDADAFVAKFDDDGRLVWATLLGGSSFDDADAIEVDATGNAYVRGVTRSPDFPATPEAFDATFNGGFDVFVAKVATDGSALAYSTFVGGSGFDSGSEIALSPTGEAYIAGITGSSDFPTTAGAYDTTFNGQGGPFPPFFGGDFDAYATKLSADGSHLEYSTLLGGGGLEAGLGIDVDPRGNATVVGPTVSPDFPTTAGAYDTSFNGATDTFVASLTADGSGLRYSTFLGGSGPDSSQGVAVTPSGEAHVTGGTGSPDFPTSPGAADPTFNGVLDAYVTRLSPDGSSLVWSTFVGGAGDDFGAGIEVDASGETFITGDTSSADLPTTASAFDTTFNGGTDAFVVQLDRTGSRAYSSFLGGSSNDDGADIAANPQGQAFVAGSTTSSDFPTTPGAFDATFNGGSDAFVAKLEVPHP